MSKSGVEVTSPEMWGLPPTMFHDKWKTFLIHFHKFAELPTTKGRSLESPEFTCNDQKWSVSLYPGGDGSDYPNDVALLFSEACCFAEDMANSGYVSLYLNHRSRGNTTATFEVKIINKYGDTLETRKSSNNRLFDMKSSNSGWGDIIKLSDVLDNSNAILDKNSTLTVVVSIKQAPIPAKKVPIPAKKTPLPAKKTQLTVDQQNDLVLKKLVVKCLLNNQLLPKNSTIGSRGRDEVLKLQSDPPLATLRDQKQLPKTRDPPEADCSAMQPERYDVRTVQLSSGVLSQPPRPEEVRYQLYSPLQPKGSVCTAPVQNDFYSSQKSCSSAPSPYHNIGERGLSSQAMERRRHYKEMILQQQLAKTQAQLSQAQRLIAHDHYPYSITS
mmetsp:Transcript_4371/g.7364  ORF Transcript_4371/g.7364 Transcript_4371/m.7364 type:complete len:385 (+) Transcript_4371:956-2110(+)